MTVAWTPIDADLPAVVKEKPPHRLDRPWLVLLQFVPRKYTHLRLTVAGLWTILPLKIPCAPDGVEGLMLANSELYVLEAWPGCAIGRLGGSSAIVADRPAQQGETGASAASSFFAIGSECILKRPPDVLGPLFVGFNLRRGPIEIAELSITVEGAEVTPPPAPAPVL